MTPYRRRGVLPAIVVTVVALVQALVFGLSPSAGGDSSPTQSQTVVEDTAERDAYVEYWAERIDSFNAGFPLEGYGATFADAAHMYGVDPRLSPAIARVESGSGSSCVYSCNAWGWGTQSWSDWETAIYAHVAGLASNYGGDLTWDMAAVYCPVGTDEWYAQVEGCMAQIG